MKDGSRGLSVAIPPVHGRKCPHPGRVPDHQTLRDSLTRVRLGEAFGVRRQSEAETALSPARDVQAHQTPPEPKRCPPPLPTALQSRPPGTARQTLSLAHRAASSSPPQAILCRTAGFSRQILAIPVPLPHECGVPGGLNAALLTTNHRLSTIDRAIWRMVCCWLLLGGIESFWLSSNDPQLSIGLKLLVGAVRSTAAN